MSLSRLEFIFLTITVVMSGIITIFLYIYVIEDKFSNSSLAYGITMGICFGLIFGILALGYGIRRIKSKQGLNK
ncbi:MAG TPA: hypothetical protein VMV49_13020 [Candidatus Deferrimicrobium sp.]|nr:hypothetical protein [Candidatus Deferrimicrobium sp.]